MSTDLCPDCGQTIFGGQACTCGLAHEEMPAHQQRILELNKKVQELENTKEAMLHILTVYQDSCPKCQFLTREAKLNDPLRGLVWCEQCHREYAAEPLLMRITQLEEALKEIAAEHDWGNDTALRRSITNLVSIARKALEEK